MCRFWQETDQFNLNVSAVRPSRENYTKSPAVNGKPVDRGRRGSNTADEFEASLPALVQLVSDVRQAARSAFQLVGAILRCAEL